MVDENNLNRPRPDAWKHGALFPFIEECWSNSVGVVGNNNVVAARLTMIDAIFEETHHNLKPSTPEQIIPSLLMLRSFSAFRASVMVCLSLPTESYPLQRSCLEAAGYAKLIATIPELGIHWLKRDEDPQAKSRFSNRAVRESIAHSDESLASIYQSLYEGSIDFGAHPNEKSVVSNVIAESVGTEALQFVMLGGDGPMLQHALRFCAQVGICSLKVFNLIFRKQFEKHNFESKIERASCTF